MLLVAVVNSRRSRLIRLAAASSAISARRQLIAETLGRRRVRPSSRRVSAATASHIDFGRERDGAFRRRK